MLTSTYLITGASDGLGLQAAIQLAHQSVALILVGRNSQKLEQVKQTIQARAGNSQIHTFAANLSSQREIRQLSQAIHEKFERIDVLINNAGSVSAQFELTEDRIEKTIATNHLGYFLLTSLLMDLLRQAPQARIINVASNSHFSGRIDFESFTTPKSYTIIKAYSQSKLANLLFTYELAARLQGTPITVNAISPGRVKTGIGNKGQPWYVSWVWSWLTSISSISVERGAAIYVYLTISEDVAQVTGKYFDKYQKTIPSSALSYDKNLAQQLWEQSEKHIGEPFRL